MDSQFSYLRGSSYGPWSRAKQLIHLQPDQGEEMAKMLSYDTSQSVFEESKVIPGLYIKVDARYLDATEATPPDPFYTRIESDLAKLRDGGPLGQQLVNKIIQLINSDEGKSQGKHIFIVPEGAPMAKAILPDSWMQPHKKYTQEEANTIAAGLANRLGINSKGAGLGASVLINMGEISNGGLDADGIPRTGLPADESAHFTALVHELLHASRMLKGRASAALEYPYGFVDEEFRTVGLKQWENKPLTENSIREEHGLPLRKSYSAGEGKSVVTDYGFDYRLDKLIVELHGYKEPVAPRKTYPTQSEEDSAPPPLPPKKSRAPSDKQSSTSETAEVDTAIPPIPRKKPQTTSDKQPSESTGAEVDTAIPPIPRKKPQTAPDKQPSGSAGTEVDTPLPPIPRKKPQTASDKQPSTSPSDDDNAPASTDQAGGSGSDTDLTIYTNSNGTKYALSKVVRGLKIEVPNRNPEFYAETEAALATLRNTRSGVKLLSSLESRIAHGKELLITYTSGGNEARPQLTESQLGKYGARSLAEQIEIAYKLAHKGHFFKGEGTGAVVSFNPERSLDIAADGQMSIIKSSAKAHLLLAHELIHANRLMKGTSAGASGSETDPGSARWQEEWRTVGLGKWKNKTPSENSFRKEMGEPTRPDYQVPTKKGTADTPDTQTQGETSARSLHDLLEIPISLPGSSKPAKSEPVLEQVRSRVALSNPMQEAFSRLQTTIETQASEEGWAVKTITDVKFDETGKQVQVTVQDQAGQTHEINIDSETLAKAFTENVKSMLKTATEGHANGTVSGVANALGVYSTLRGLMDFLKGVASGEHFDGQMIGGAVMVGWGLSEITGLNRAITDKLGNVLRSALFKETASAIEAGYAGGLEALIGQSVSKLGQLAGLGEEATAVLARSAAKIPFVGMAMGGYILYTDAELIKSLQASGASKERIDKAIAATAMDALATVCFSAAPFAGPLEPVFVTIGSIANFVRGFLSDTPSGNPTSVDMVLDVWSLGAVPILRKIFSDGSYEGIQEFRGKLDKMQGSTNFDQFVTFHTSDDVKLFSFIVLEDQNNPKSDLTKASTYYGEQQVTLDDHLNVTISYLAPHRANFDDKYSWHARYRDSVKGKFAQGDDRFILMGVSTSYSGYYSRHPDGSHYVDCSAVSPRELQGGDHIYKLGLKPNRSFSITGNLNDNTFISAWSSADDPYQYTVYGGGGDDSLIMSRYGQYSFDGGADGKVGDGLSSSGIKADLVPATSRLLMSLANLSIGHVGALDRQVLDFTQAYALTNLSVWVSNVENLYGSNKDEVLVGNDAANVIVTGGGDDVVFVSGGGDRYIVAISDKSRVAFQEPVGSLAKRDTVMLDANSKDLQISLVKVEGQPALSIINNQHDTVPSILKFTSLDLLLNMDFATRDGKTFRYLMEADGSLKRWNMIYGSPGNDVFEAQDNATIYFSGGGVTRSTSPR
jgi:hypothetical protein